MGRGDRGARLRGVRAATGAGPGRASDVNTRRRERDIRLALRKRRQLVLIVDRRDRHHAAERGRVVDGVVAIASVARGRDDQRPLVLRVVHCRLKRGRVATARGADVDHPRAVVGRVQDGFDHRAIGAAALRVECFDRQQPGMPGDASYADGVVADGGDDPGNRGPM